MNNEVLDRDFQTYVAAHRARLHRLAFLLCGDAHRAEDLVQQALIKTYRVWGRLVRDGNIDAYVRKILLNTHIDEMRRPSRRERLEEAPDRTAPSTNFEERSALFAGLVALPRGQRQVVVLRYYLGLSVNETAEELGLAPGTVKSQSADALRSLERSLSAVFPERTRE